MKFATSEKSATIFTVVTGEFGSATLPSSTAVLIASDILAASAQSYTWKFQYKTTAGETAGIQDVKLAILQLTAAGERVFPLPKDETIWQSQSNKREFPLPGVQT